MVNQPTYSTIFLHILAYFRHSRGPAVSDSMIFVEKLSGEQKPNLNLRNVCKEPILLDSALRCNSQRLCRMMITLGYNISRSDADS